MVTWKRLHLPELADDDIRMSHEIELVGGLLVVVLAYHRLNSLCASHRSLWAHECRDGT